MRAFRALVSGKPSTTFFEEKTVFINRKSSFKGGPTQTPRKEVLGKYHLTKPLFKIVAVFFVVVSVFTQRPPVAQAATYTFTQSSWSGGTTSNTMVHPTNQTGWTEYSSASGIDASTTFSLSRNTPSLVASSTPVFTVSLESSTTTPAIDTSGATLLVAVVTTFGATPCGTVTDSKSNTWNSLTRYSASGGSTSNICIHYSYNKAGGALSVGSGHTFTVSALLTTIFVSAWSGTITSSDPFDVQNGNAVGTGSFTTIQPGSITPSISNSLIITGAGHNASTNWVSINSSFSFINRYANSSTEGGGSAYLVQNSAAAVNPTWTNSQNMNHTAAAIAAFKPSYQTVGALISSAYDSGSVGNIINQVTWAEDSALPANTTVVLSMRTGSSTSSLASASWVDIATSTTSTLTSGCSKSSGVVTCGNSAIPAAFKDASDDEWFQYKFTLRSSDGAYAPTVSGFSAQYVVNGPPDFNTNYPTTSAGGVQAYQVATSTDANFGKVIINYSVRDTDSASGGVTPGFVTPSFQYNISGVWTTVSAGYLNATALDNKAVNESTYTEYQAVWDAKSQIAGQFATSTQVRVTVNDNDAANNTATQSSSAFTLDTTNPTAAITVDVSGGTLSATTTDNSMVSYLLSNNSSTTPDGLNGISGIWQTASSTSVSTTTPWSFASSTYPTVYMLAKDPYNNNSATTTAVAPATVTGVEIHDVSNVSSGTYKEFISWDVYTATTSAAFSKYEVYSSTDGSSYSLLSTITDSAINYYLDASVATSTTYYYKLRIVDTNGDKSAYSSVVSDQPNGQGGSDNTAPVITNVTATSTQSTWTTITWTTDELSNSVVEYATLAGAYTFSETVQSYVTSHSVTITGLNTGTTYYYRVKSTDIAGNTATDNNSDNDYTFSTISGPSITSVSVAPADTSAVVTWNTNLSSDSFVYYSTSASLTGALTAGTATLVSTSTGSSSLFQHRVTLSGLSAGSTYYFYVKSTDANSNVATDNNGGSYYSFQTTLDTNAPTITNISVPLTTATQAAVVWTTDEPATSRVAWGTASGSYSEISALDATLTTSHMVVITGLTASTQYYFVVRSKDAANNETISSENDFTSAAANDIVYVAAGGGGGGSQAVQDTAPPIISAVSFSSSSLTSFGVTITFATNEDTIGMIEYGTTDQYGLSNAKSKFASSHSITLSGLRQGTLYHFHAKAIDKSGNEAGSADQTFTTKFLTEDLSNVNVDDLYQYQDEIEQQIASLLPSIVPPFIGKIQTANITQDSVDLTWETNINAFSSVEYATEDEYQEAAEKPYAAELSDTTTKTQAHAMTLSGLTPNTRYHFRIKAYTLPEAASYSKDVVFVTKAGDIEAHVAEVTTSSFRIVWSTPDPSDAVVEYRNMATGEVNRKVDEQKKTFHEILIDNLPPDTQFQVKVSSVNGKGNLLVGKQPLRVTTGKDGQAPAISGLKIESTLVPGSSDKVQTLVRWITDEPATTVVYYEEGSGAPTANRLANKVDDQGTFTKDHIAVLGSLKAGAIYRIQIESTDEAGNTTLSQVKTIVVPRQSQSISDIIFKNFEDSFKFLQNGN